MENKKSIYLKLLKIQEEIEKFTKDGDTSTEGNRKGYKYVSGDQVLKAIKPLMNREKVILKQEVVSIDNVRQDYNTKYGSKSEILSKVMMKFTWIDCETGEKDENMFGANGQNDWEKGLGSALTYGERYFLLKFFHIPTDEDDIDNPNRKTSAPVPVPTPPKTPVDSRVKISPKAFDKLIDRINGKPAEGETPEVPGEKDAYDKAMKAFIFSEDQRAELELVYQNKFPK